MTDFISRTDGTLIDYREITRIEQKIYSFIEVAKARIKAIDDELWDEPNPRIMLTLESERFELENEINYHKDSLKYLKEMRGND